MSEDNTGARARRPARARKPVAPTAIDNSVAPPAIGSPAAPPVADDPEASAADNPEDIDAGDFAAAMELSDRLDQPVRVPTENHLETGLADYGMWVAMFSAFPPTKPDPKTFRRGRIWT